MKVEIGIIGAMQPEVEAIIAALSDRESKTVSGITFHTMDKKHPVIVTNGKINDLAGLLRSHGSGLVGIDISQIQHKQVIRRKKIIRKGRRSGRIIDMVYKNNPISVEKFSEQSFAFTVIKKRMISNRNKHSMKLIVS